MAVYGLVGASTQQRCHLFSQDVAHAYRVQLYEFRKHLAELTLQVVTVLLHLLYEVFARQQGIKTSIDSRVDIGWQMGCQVVDAIRQQLFVNLVEQVLYQSRIALQGVGESIAGSYQFFVVPSFKKHKDLILDLQVGKSQFGGAVLILRRWHQLVDVLLQMNL